MISTLKDFYTNMRNDVLKELKKDKYKDVYVSYIYGEIDLIYDIDNDISLWQTMFSDNSCFIMTDYNGSNAKGFSCDEFRETFKDSIDFTKWETLVSDDGKIHTITVRTLIEQGIITDKYKFLDVYMNLIGNMFYVTKATNFDKVIDNIRLKQLCELYCELALHDVNPNDLVIAYINKN